MILESMLENSGLTKGRKYFVWNFAIMPAILLEVKMARGCSQILQIK